MCRENTYKDIYIDNVELGAFINLESMAEEMTRIIMTDAKSVYDALGPGFPEVMYHKAMEVELRTKCIPYETEVITPINYKNFNVGHTRADIIVNKSYVLEFKALSYFNADTGILQLKNYMKSHGISCGIIINFGQPNKANEGSLNFRMITWIPEHQKYCVWDWNGNEFVDQSIHSKKEINLK
jgi:GxxExxY protein